ncbi:hypothetical protein A9Z65_02645 [Moraxella nonliquefaciens]|nr:hypothetical protein A9Z65_02645 [Moraxella nonliquefaciens]
MHKSLTCIINIKGKTGKFQALFYQFTKNQSIKRLSLLKYMIKTMTPIFTHNFCHTSNKNATILQILTPHHYGKKNLLCLPIMWC